MSEAWQARLIRAFGIDPNKRIDCDSAEWVDKLHRRTLELLDEHGFEYSYNRPPGGAQSNILIRIGGGTVWDSGTITDSELLGRQEKLVVWLAERQPVIVCLCGSTRFWETFQRVGLQETLAGKIVLSVGAATASDKAHGITPEVKKRLDRLHLHKIDMAGEVLIINVDGYIGETTQAELDYARKQGKKIRFLEGD